jgi:hypothetical protein
LLVMSDKRATRAVPLGAAGRSRFGTGEDITVEEANRRTTCDRCGKVSMLNEAHTTGRRREMPLGALLARMRHDGCGGIAGDALCGRRGIGIAFRVGDQAHANATLATPGRQPPHAGRLQHTPDSRQFLRRQLPLSVKPRA